MMGLAGLRCKISTRFYSNMTEMRTEVPVSVVDLTAYKCLLT